MNTDISDRYIGILKVNIGIGIGIGFGDRYPTLIINHTVESEL